MRRFLYLFTLLLTVLLCVGCAPENPTGESMVQSTPPAVTEPSAAEAAAPTGIHGIHLPGDSFSMTILLEGMEETVHARHYEDPKGVYRMDYFYEDFALTEEAAAQRFTWQYLEGSYLRIRTEADTPPADAAETAAIAGQDAVAVTTYSGDSVTTVYYLDTLTIEIACPLEALEGIGARIHAMLATLEII